MKVVVVSDVHLGYEKSNKTSFNIFLESLEQDRELTDLVLLGDIVDMWRRDASGVFLENHDSIERFLNISKNVAIHYVAGNHDFHVLKLKSPGYPFHFVQNLTLTDGQFTYRLLHGYEFDPDQKAEIMEILCRIMSDEVGEFESEVWGKYAAKWSVLKYLAAILSRKKNAIKQQTDNLQRKPEERLRETRVDLEKRAASTIKPNEILVFGHTHVPFINKAGNFVNSGSWVADSLIHNTYVVLSGGKANLYMFKSGEITERAE